MEGIARLAWMDRHGKTSREKAEGPLCMRNIYISSKSTSRSYCSKDGRVAQDIVELLETTSFLMYQYTSPEARVVHEVLGDIGLCVKGVSKPLDVPYLTSGFGDNDCIVHTDSVR